MLSFDVWCAPVNSFEEMLHDPQVLHNQNIRTVKHQALGEIGVLAAPIRYRKTPLTYDAAPPVLGQHSEEILEELGYDAGETERIIERQK